MKSRPASSRPGAASTCSKPTIGGTTLVALAPVVDGRLDGWTEADLDFRAVPTFDEPTELWSALIPLSDETLMAGGEVPSPRYSFRRLGVIGHRLRVEAGCTDWSWVATTQDILFRNAAPQHRAEVGERWRSSSRSIAEHAVAAGFSHHLAVHVLVVSQDGYIVTGVRRNVSNQLGRVSLSFEEQLELAHVSSRSWNSERRLKRVDGDLGPFAAIRRGLREELGVTDEAQQTRILAVGIEDSSIAVNFLAYVEVQQTMDQIFASWTSAVDRAESVILPPIRALTMDNVGDFLARGPAVAAERDGPGRWHSSSVARSVLAVAHRYGVPRAQELWATYSESAAPW